MLTRTRLDALTAGLALALTPWFFDAFRIVWQGFRTIRHAFPTCMTELWILDGVRALAAGQSLYPPTTTLPFSLHVYNTLTYLPAGLAGKLGGLSIDQLMVASRVFPFLCGMGILAVAALYAFRLSRHWFPPLLAVLALLAYHTSTLTDFFRNRPETPGIFFSLLGWYLVTAKPRRWPIVAGVCFAAAFGFKQVFIAAPAAAVIQLLLEREAVGRIGRMIATYLSLVLAGTLVSYFLFGRGYFDHTYLAMASNPFDFMGAARLFGPVLIKWHWGYPLLLALVVSLVAAISFALRERRLEPVWIYLAICAAVTAVTQAKVGADVNYHGELSILMVLCIVTAVARLTEAGTIWLVAPALPLVAAALGSTVQYGWGWNEVCLNRIFPSAYCYSEAPPFGDRAAHVARYRAVADEALLLDPEIGVRVGNAAVTDWFLLDLTFKSGFLDFDELRSAVNSRRYAAIVFNKGTNSVWANRLQQDAIDQGYVVGFQDETILEYRR